MKTFFLSPQPLPGFPLLLANAVGEEKPRQLLSSVEPIKVLEVCVTIDKELDQPQNWDEAWFTNYE